RCDVIRLGRLYEDAGAGGGRRGGGEESDSGDSRLVTAAQERLAGSLAGPYLAPLGRSAFQARFDVHWVPFALAALREPSGQSVRKALWRQPKTCLDSSIGAR